MKKKILIMDAYSAIHVGNGALLENTIDLCERAWGDCEIFIMTMDKKTNLLKYDKKNLYSPIFGDFCKKKSFNEKAIWGLEQILFMMLHILNESIFKIPSKKIVFSKEQKEAILVIEQADICISCGGEMISDTFYRMLPFWLFGFWLAIKKKKCFIIFPQSIGPLNMKWTKVLVKAAIKDSALIVARDMLSYNTLKELKFVKEKVLFCPDVAIRQKYERHDVYDINKYFKYDEKKIVGITLSKPPANEIILTFDLVKKINEQVNMLDSNEYKIIIMPSNYIHDGVSDDYTQCMELKKKLEKKFDISILENRPYFPIEFTTLLSQLEVLISTRMHVSILATSISIPVIAINTQNKVLSYMKIIGMERFCVEYECMDDIYWMMEEVFLNSKEIKKKLKEKNNELRALHDHFVSRLSRL